LFETLARVDYEVVIPKKQTAAIYARVSTDDQNADMQLAEVRQYAGRQGWDVLEFVDKGVSGMKRSRPGLDACMNAARLKQVDIVLVWKLDRFGRSLSNLIENILLLDSYGVRFISVTQGLDTDLKNPTSRLMMHILGAVAEFERSMIVDRVRSGMASAKRSGKHCGRPKGCWSRIEARELLEAGLSWRQISTKMGVPVTSLRRALQSVPKG
jgi:putative DNA-invertase from lambdoid prophage Rac